MGTATDDCAFSLASKEAGAEKVLIMDKNKLFGGCSRLANVFFAVGSPAQRRRGLDLSVDEMFLEHMTKTSWHCENKLVREWYQGGDELVTWLEEKGVVIIDVVPLGGKHTLHEIEGGGNTMIILILVVVLVAIVGFAGWYYMTKMKGKTGGGGKKEKAKEEKELEEEF